MQSLSYFFEGRGLPFTDDVELSMVGLARSRNVLNEWDVETLSVPVRDMFEGQGLVEQGLPEMTRKSVISTQCLENSLDDVNCDSGGKSVPSSSTITLNSSVEFETRFTGSAIKTYYEKLAPTCLNTEKLAAPRDFKGDSVSVGKSVLSSPGASVSAKRTRIANLQSQIPVCIVDGCIKDLSFSKEYHKRHKVCDIHSKTAVVIVNGINQRFCQQCSRFHILAEFDDGKRSCRKRLVGHNERRRKPHLDVSTFSGTDLSWTSLPSSKKLPRGFFGQLCDEPANLSRHITAPLKFGCSLPKFPLHLNEMRKHPSKNCPSSPLSVLELSASSTSSDALSLLSAQSQSSLSNSAGISMDCPLIFEEYPHSILTFYSNSTNSREIFTSPGEVDQKVLDSRISVGFGTPTNEFSQESSSALILKRYPAPEDGNTVDLLQL